MKILYKNIFIYEYMNQQCYIPAVVYEVKKHVYDALDFMWFCFYMLNSFHDVYTENNIDNENNKDPLLPINYDIENSL
jgi:hypothetical protein